MGNYNSVEVQAFKSIAATPASFILRGGNYSLTAHATWGGGSVTLNRLAADGATWISTGLTLAADGMVNGTLPGGTYQLAVVTATAIYADVTSTVTSL